MANFFDNERANAEQEKHKSGKVLKTVLLGQAAHTPDDHREH